MKTNSSKILLVQIILQTIFVIPSLIYFFAEFLDIYPIEKFISNNHAFKMILIPLFGLLSNFILESIKCIKDKNKINGRIIIGMVLIPIILMTLFALNPPFA